MISRHTVLVLGAGASTPYGFPTGRTLLLQICDSIMKGDSSLMSPLMELGFDHVQLGEFRRDLMESMQPSVDAFLENRPDFINIGKAAIAASLIPYEKQEQIETRSPEMKWYEYLFHHMGPTHREIRQGRLSIVTFNYDRSLEYFLYNAFTRSYGLWPEATLDFLKAVPVVHVYGTLGTPHFIDQKGRPYNPSASSGSIRLAADSIIVGAEAHPSHRPFAQAKALLAEARVVAFLGFGYHPLNIERLGLPPSPGPELLGTAYALGRSELNAIRKLFPYDISLGSPDQDVLQFLRNNDVFTAR